MQMPKPTAPLMAALGRAAAAVTVAAPAGGAPQQVSPLELRGGATVTPIH